MKELEQKILLLNPEECSIPSSENVEEDLEEERANFEAELR